MSNNKKIGPSNVLRLFIWFAATISPIILLTKGIYSSFLFTFSIPLLWQVSFLGEPVSSLGLKRKSSGTSIITGFITGVVLAMLSGKILKFFGMTGYTLSNFQKLEYSFGLFKISFLL